MSPQDKAAARYKDKAMQGTYENALKVARGGGAELFTEDGRQRRAGSLSVAFWNGYDGREPGIMEPASSMARAAFMAGRSFAKERPGVLRPVGKPATGAAMTKEHDMTTPHEKAAEALRLADHCQGLAGLRSTRATLAMALKMADKTIREYAALLQAQPAEAGRVPPADSVRRWIADFETSIRRLPKNRMALAETSLSQMRGWADTLSKEQPAEAGRVPPGWRLVPVEPTDEMVGAMAVVEASSVINGVRCVGISGAVEAFEAMLAAAPQPPKEQPAMTGATHTSCSERLRRQGVPYPRTCQRCGLGPCREVFAPKEHEA